MEMILANYGQALTALMVLCIAVLIQAWLCAILAFSEKGGQTPGSIKGGPELFSWRVLRTYLNSTENIALFGLVLLTAMIVGVSPKWVNLLAIIHVGARLLFWPVYYSKIGIKTPGLRTLCYIAGNVANLALAIMTLLALSGL